MIPSAYPDLARRRLRRSDGPPPTECAILPGESVQFYSGVDTSAHASSKLVKNATLKVYPGGSHGLADTHKDELNADLIAFLRA